MLNKLLNANLFPAELYFLSLLPSIVEPRAKRRLLLALPSRWRSSPRSIQLGKPLPSIRFKPCAASEIDDGTRART